MEVLVHTNKFRQWTQEDQEFRDILGYIEFGGYTLA